MYKKILIILVVAAIASGIISAVPVQHVKAIVSCTFTRDLYLGISGDDVLCLQQYLNDGGKRVKS